MFEEVCDMMDVALCCPATEEMTSSAPGRRGGRSGPAIQTSYRRPAARRPDREEGEEAPA